ncbi:hypothetical protein [Paenibacillus dakarensis]|uniref:hypothetical protein n=1 Tax=Paenibacillus dakarensis TaxID=1527293 RepID=UPI0006D5AD81|nr:hypothetical protein [Paenibacillus dakarensis]
MGIHEIEQKIEQVRAELHAENQRGALKDSHKVAELESKLADLTQQLDVETRLAENEQVHEQRVEETNSQIAYTLDNLEVDGVTMRELFRNETSEGAEFAYQVVSAAVKKLMMDGQEALLNEIRNKEDQLAAAKAEIESSQKRYDDLYEVNAQLRLELAQAKAETEEAERKRDAAASQLDEANNEVKRLESQVDDLRKEIAVGAVNAHRVIDIGSNDALESWKKQRQAEEDAKPAIYDVEEMDLKGRMLRGKLAATDEEITFNYLERGKYREVSAEEAPSFRRAAEEQKRNHEDLAQRQDVEETVTPFPQEAGTAIDGLDQADVNGEMEDEAAGSVEERLAAIEQRVAALEYRALKNGEAA